MSPFVRSSPHPDRSASEREAPQDARDHAGTTRPDATARADDDRCLTVADVAARLNLDPDTVRRLFRHESGVIVICRPRKGTRVYRTLRIPERVYRRVVTRLTQVV